MCLIRKERGKTVTIKGMEKHTRTFHLVWGSRNKQQINQTNKTSGKKTREKVM